VDVSRQALDRSAPGLDEVLFQELIADYNMRLDLQILTGSGSGANAKGILSDANRIVETWTQGTPTVALFQQPGGKRPVADRGSDVPGTDAHPHASAALGMDQRGVRHDRPSAARASG
jgi:hypothetical protein